MNQSSDASQTNYNYKTNPYPFLKKKLTNFPLTNQIFLSRSTATDRFQCQKRVIRIAKTYSKKGGSETTVTTGFLVFRVDSHVVYSRMNISSQIGNAVAIFTSVGKHLDYSRRKGPGTRRKQNELQQDPAEWISMLHTMGRTQRSLCIRGAIWPPCQLISSGHQLFESFSSGWRFAVSRPLQLNSVL